MERSSLTDRESPRPGVSGDQAVANTAERVRVGVAGATGYAGQQLLRLIAQHPFADLTVAMSSAPAGPPRTLPALARIWDGTVIPFSAAALVQDIDVVFLALPEEAAAEVAPAILDRGVRIIDLSGAFRLRNAGERQRWYPATKPTAVDPVYGLTERNRAALRNAQLIACPGCYPTAALLALAPLSDAGLLAGDIVIDAKSGVSGAGKKPTERTHFSECHGSVAAYAVSGHRHQPEIEQELGAPVTFVPHLVPLDRGILETIYATAQGGTTERDVRDVMESAYRGAPFVRLRGETLPEIKHVAHTNFCDIGWHVNAVTGRLILVSALDNLIKGAAGQAIQNFNVALGFDERTGLLQ
jgi:N-acetyl-gamma-glutamyl-phosphate reductase